MMRVSGASVVGATSVGVAEDVLSIVVGCAVTVASALGIGVVLGATAHPADNMTKPKIRYRIIKHLCLPKAVCAFGFLQ
jgi:hypothetical protein